LVEKVSVSIGPSRIEKAKRIRSAEPTKDVIQPNQAKNRVNLTSSPWP